MTTTSIDPAEVIRSHNQHGVAGCYWGAHRSGGRCEPYRLAEALLAEQARAARAAALAEEWATGCGAFGVQLVCAQRLIAVLAADEHPHLACIEDGSKPICDRCVTQHQQDVYDVEAAETMRLIAANDLEALLRMWPSLAPAGDSEAVPT